jgi:Domain of unknown function (DUF4815)
MTAGVPQRPDDFDVTRRYKKVLHIGDDTVRVACDFAFNTESDIQDMELARLGNAIFKMGGILTDPRIDIPGGGLITFGNFAAWLMGRAEHVPGATLAFDPAKVTGLDTVFVRWLFDQVTKDQDPEIVMPATGEDAEERLRAQVNLVGLNPDLMDETFEAWNVSQNAPRGWTVVSGTSQIGPPKFGERGLELGHLGGTDTILERSLVLAPATHYYVSFWLRHRSGAVPLTSGSNAKLGFYRLVPPYSQEISLVTTGTYTFQSFNFTTDGSFTAGQQAVILRISIPAAVVNTNIFLDELLITTSPLGPLDLARHYIPLFTWDRATDEVLKVVERAGQIHQGDWEPYLDGYDIINIEHNQGLLDFAARRTYDAHGHFKKPRALVVRRDPTADVGTQLGLMIGPGKAYVHGYECRVDVDQPLLVDQSLNTLEVVDEYHTTQFGSETSAANLYQLEKNTEGFPIQAVTELTIIAEVRKQITKTGAGGTDDTGEEGVTDILAVSYGTSGTITGRTGGASFTFPDSNRDLKIQTSDYVTGALTAEQSIDFATGTWTMNQVLEALNQGSGPAYRKGHILGNIIFESDGASPPHLRLRTKTTAAGFGISVTAANTVFGFLATDTCATAGVGVPPNGTLYAEGTSWNQIGNTIDWVGAPNPEPGTGLSYTVVLQHATQVTSPGDFILGGSFPVAKEYYYVVTLINSADVEGLPGAEFHGAVEVGGILKVSWGAQFSALAGFPATNATRSYNVYRSDVPGGPYGLIRNRRDQAHEIIDWYDSNYIAPNMAIHPPTTSTAQTMLNQGVVTPYGPGWINFNNGLTGIKPVHMSQLVVTYTYYVSTIWTVYIDQHGIIDLQPGAPSETPTPPTLRRHLMPLAYLRPLPNTSEVVIDNITAYDRATFQDIRLLINRTEVLYQNDANQEIQNVALDRDAVPKKGVFADGMTREAQSDFVFDRGGIHYSTSLNTALRVCGLQSTVAELDLNRADTSTTINIGGEVMLPEDPALGEEAFVVQNRWSEDISINPFLGLRFPTPTIRIYPRSYGWTMHNASRLSVNEAASRRYTILSGLWTRLTDRPFMPPWNSDADAIQQRSQQRILKELETIYQFDMERHTIDIQAYGFGPNQDDIYGMFGDLPVDLVPVAPGVAGTHMVNGKTTIKADAMGRWAGNFRVPPQTPVAITTFKVRSPSDGPGYRGSATYTPLAKIIPPPDLPEQDLFLDPIAQSIRNAGGGGGKTVCAVDLCFTGKPLMTDSRPALYVQIRPIVNGFPTRDVLANVTLSPDEVTVAQTTDPLTGATAWTPTRIDFSPYYVELPPALDQLAITLIGHPSYRVLTATLNQQDGATGERIADNPYPEGVFFFSSNGTTWNVNQGRDLWMNVYTRKFSTEEAIWESDPVDISALQVSRLWLGVDSDTPIRSRIKWEVEFQDSRIIKISELTKFAPPFHPTSVRLRARLSLNDENFQYLSPSFNRRSLGLIVFSRATSGTHISEAIILTQPVTKIKIYPVMYMPTGTYIDWYAGCEDIAGNVTWSAAFGSFGAPTVTPIDEYWSEYEYLELTLPANVPSGDPRTKIRLRAELSATDHWKYGPLFAQVGATLI